MLMPSWRGSGGKREGLKEGGGSGNACVLRGGRLSPVDTCRCLSSAECECSALSGPRLVPRLTPTLHLSVAALQQAQEEEVGEMARRALYAKSLCLRLLRGIDKKG
ncbi:hypothetical protein VZT92_017654 [Zoarces viviparus]|uniref:Uncharacterized protein n=1 Tax=Zoarces viviparus TaxID=48416 RepID=A0AAW1EMI8_ZOAVI